MSVDQCLYKTITFHFKKSSNGIRNSKSPYKATFPLESFVSLVCKVDKRLVWFAPDDDHRAEDFLAPEKFEINEATFNMLMKVFIKHDEKDPHVGTSLSFIFEPLDRGIGTISVLSTDIKYVSYDIYDKDHCKYKLTTTHKVYQLSKDDYEFFKKFITEK